ncbi:MAG TPA: transglutaminase-like domain-containing protein [Clostridiales bacterium]|nr:transglutaminase-like domain-containing protein [Clostridiales bacterium]HQP69251.1 transglutaminase-like domain-containing protein [Clostridiales bacterium]
MKEFPFLISAALIYWGYNSDHLLLSFIFAFVLESFRFIKFRWDLKQSDFNYISMLSTITSAGYIVYFVNVEIRIGIISALIQFMPVILFPLIFFYIYGTSDHVNAKRLFLLFVTNKYSVVHPYIRFFRPDYFYFTAVLLAGSIKAGLYSFFIVSLLLIPVLIKLRSKDHPIFKFIISYSLVIILSLIMQSGIYGSFYLLRDFLTDLYIKNIMDEIDSSIGLGDIAGQKDNFVIELRAEFYSGKKGVHYLRDRVYNAYYKGKWSEAGATQTKIEINEFEFGKTPIDSVRIYFFSESKKDRIKIPFSAIDFSGLNIGTTYINSLGSISADRSQHLVDYKTYSRSDALTNLFGLPSEADTKLIDTDAKTADIIIDSLSLKNLPPDQVFKRLRDHFISDYRYSVDYSFKEKGDLLKTFIKAKKGHCELFASLSCIVFRRLGYPSRYVTGYLVSEYSNLEKKYVARKKDRHSWIVVWNNNGSWVEMDTTPPDISSFKKNTFISRFYDMMSYIYHEAFMFKKENNDLLRKILVWSLFPLGLFLLYRILKDVKTYKVKNENGHETNPYRRVPELDAIEKALGSSDVKHENETVGSWFTRFKNSLIFEKLELIRKYYYRIRYGRSEPDNKARSEFNEALKDINKERSDL